MDIGKVYKIWYKDAQDITRARTVKIIKETAHMIEYVNQFNNSVEGISISMLQRFEKVDKYEGKD